MKYLNNYKKCQWLCCNTKKSNEHCWRGCTLPTALWSPTLFSFLYMLVLTHKTPVVLDRTFTHRYLNHAYAFFFVWPCNYAWKCFILSFLSSEKAWTKRSVWYHKVTGSNPAFPTTHARCSWPIGDFNEARKMNCCRLHIYFWETDHFCLKFLTLPGVSDFPEYTD